MKFLKDFYQFKNDFEKISMLTAYDYPSAKQAEAAGIDIVLVGDSLGMTVLGYDDTVSVTLDDMIHHGKAVRRGAPDTFMVVDMPFGAVARDTNLAIERAVKLYQATHANALKVEGAHTSDFIKGCQEIGIPIVGHLGLTPQSVGLTGFKVQGQSEETRRKLIDEAKRMEDDGAVMLVLEAVPQDVAAFITEQLRIPVIGIGAGPDTDGQVLVYHDVLNYGVDFKPKFVKRYGDFSNGVEALRQYHEDVKHRAFPEPQHSFKARMEEGERERYDNMH
ncbi:3-methyl-2-oxobutanoate hydroxymethyltransferase [Staphylococcus massiliensis]|uniref:3-methyl-2-oxobutanoate hydroxymethyltransferase n=1 Tax=Staphylococcus massiliensis TaxID=555791 RepID=UPI001EDE7E93|nr:3-methyl-2-oxobutanoate hydroxymethyltransferase [Staphylococcus massiliensis]MCG3399157.1 3-methyl-2-oxobutanoate hydroxymethyltransferase [Staphylococcus massiliensis]